MLAGSGDCIKTAREKDVSAFGQRIAALADRANNLAEGADNRLTHVCNLGAPDPDGAITPSPLRYNCHLYNQLDIPVSTIERSIIALENLLDRLEI